MYKSNLTQKNRSNYNNSIVTNKAKCEPFRITDNVITLGKYKGKKLSEVPRSYLKWMEKEMDLDKYRLKILKGFL